MRRIIVAITIIFASVLGPAGLAWGCGGLIAPNGSVQLVRTSTLVAYDNGIERYITNFEFSGTPESFGSIVPLPGEPITVERAGDWTLQRLEREVRPELAAARQRATASFEAAEDAGVEVLLETRIDSLDITIVKGGGREVADWAIANDFTLDDEAARVLDEYSVTSPYFMAARFDAEAAFEEGFSARDGIPVMLTIPVDAPWVPLHILSIGKPGTEVVEADVFLLTESEPVLYAGEGTSLRRSGPASPLLLDDLRSDERMGWVPDEAWFSWLAVDTEAGKLTYDLEVESDEALTPTTVVQRGTEERAGRVLFTDPEPLDEGSNLWPIVLLTVGATSLGMVAGGSLMLVRRPRPIAKTF